MSTTTSLTASTAPKQVACPTCKKLSAYSTSNPFRPFCCQRCQLIDLGDWANENYRIPDTKPQEQDDEIN